MLKLAEAPTFSKKVKIPLPGQDKPASLEVVFRYRSRAELHAFFESAKKEASWWRRVCRLLGAVPFVGAPFRKMAGPALSDAERLADLIVSWEGVDVPFSVESAGTLCELYPHACTILIGAWASGQNEVRLGN